MKGKVISIYLPNGNPKEVKKASITTEKIEIYQIPRKDIASTGKQFLDFNGIYVLVDSVNTEKPQIYVGKGNVRSRVSQHDTKKEFWNSVFAVKLKDENGFNEAHTNYLEWYFINESNKLNRSINDENKQLPKTPKLTEEILCELEHYIETIKILFATLGLKVFQPIEDEDKKSRIIFYCSDKYGSKAQGEYTEEGFLVYKGAVCKLTLHKATSWVSKRDELISSGILKKDGDFYILQENKLFNSVSAASSIILGRSSNGWLEWKNEKGETLDKIERAK